MSNSATQWEGSFRGVAWLAVLFVAIAVACYRFLVPALAVAAADRVPASAARLIGDQVLQALDDQVCEPSALPKARQDRLVDRFARLRLPASADPGSYSILFRQSDALGANALALPSGAIVVTDALVELSDDDDDLMAVLAHEAGHVDGRHGLRQVFQGSVVALAVTWLIGDPSTLAAAAPAALLQAKYSRDLEREADRHAVHVLELNGIPRDRFARMLERLQAANDQRGGGGVLDYLSSHPVTRERLAAVRGG